MILCSRCPTIGKYLLTSVVTRGIRCMPMKKSSRPAMRQIPPRRSQEGGSAGKWILLGIPVITFGLGTWQIQRRKWKENLIKILNERTKRTPQPLPESLDTVDWKDLEYSRFYVNGVFVHSEEIHVQPRIIVTEKDSEGGSLISKSPRVGVHVITPFFIPERGITILINRGFVDKDLKDPEKRKEGQIEGVVRITGVLRLTEKNKIRGSNDTEKNQWSFVDVEQMAHVKGTEPILLDATAECSVKGGPIGGQTRIRLWNQHVSYIITWYSLSAFTAVMWYQRYLRKLPVMK